MLEGKDTSQLSNVTVTDWMIQEEPQLVKKIYDYFFHSDMEMSYDGEENRKRLNQVSDFISKNALELYGSLSNAEKLLLYIMKNGFGWIVYDNIESTLKIIATIFHFHPDELSASLNSLFKKFLLFKYERLKRYNFFFSPPIFLRNINPSAEAERILNNHPATYCGISGKDLLTAHYIPLIAGFISYVINFAPRSSETNEIHKIDLAKMLEFFADFGEKNELETLIKKLCRFGFFQKFNNRIILNKSLLDSILKLSINEQLFIIFLYDFMDKFDFRKSAFMTLKILGLRSYVDKKCIPLRELFFYYLNNEIYIALKNEAKSLKLLLQQEELRFVLFVKSLEVENIATLQRGSPGTISIAKDAIIMNEPHASLLNHVDFGGHFSEDNFIVEANYEVIVEPYLKPEILFKLAIIAEPLTIQTVSLFKITKESIYRSFAYGIKKEEVLEFLKAHSKHALPQNVAEGIESLINSLSLDKMDSYQIIQVNAHYSFQIKDHFKNHIIEIEPHTFLVFDPQLMKSIEGFCKKEKITIRHIHDFLNDKGQLFSLPDYLNHNIKHLHTMKDFFDFYGNEPSKGNLKIDNGVE
jgi:hypothetical protein